MNYKYSVRRGAYRVCVRFSFRSKARRAFSFTIPKAYFPVCRSPQWTWVLNDDYYQRLRNAHFDSSSKTIRFQSETFYVAPSKYKPAIRWMEAVKAYIATLFYESNRKIRGNDRKTWEGVCEPQAVAQRRARKLKKRSVVIRRSGIFAHECDRGILELKECPL